MNLRKLNTLIFVLMLVLMVAAPGIMSAQEDELEGEITIFWWHNLAGYEEDPITYQPQYGPPYVMLQEWMEMHPKVKVNLISHPIDGTEYTYIRTQLVAGTLPDLVMGWPAGELAEFLSKPENQELVYDLGPHMDEPNPYGDEPTWRQEFPLDLRLAQGSIPWEDADSVHFLGNFQTGDQGIVVFYYNKDMFEEAGVEMPIETWADLMDASKKLDEAGYAAYFADATEACCTIRWSFDWGFDQMMDPIITKMQNAIDPDRCKDQFSCFGVTDEQRAWAVTNDVWRADSEQYLEFIKLMKEWSQYWNEDWLSPEAIGADGYWYNERVAIIQDGIWHLGTHRDAQANGDFDFEFGTFAFPKITEESTELATDAPVKRHGGVSGGGAGNSFFVPQTTVENETLPIVLDYLQYITTADAHERFCSYQPVPCLSPEERIGDVVTNPKELDQLYGFFEPPMTTDSVVRYLFWPGGAGAGGDTFRRLFVQYATDEITLEELGQQLQEDFERSVERLIAENPQWDVENWPEP